MGDISQRMAEVARFSLGIPEQDSLIALSDLSGIGNGNDNLWSAFGAVPLMALGGIRNENPWSAFAVAQRGLYSRVRSVDENPIFIPWDTLQHRSIAEETNIGQLCIVRLDDGTELRVSKENSTIKPFGGALIKELIAFAATMEYAPQPVSLDATALAKICAPYIVPAYFAPDELTAQGVDPSFLDRKPIKTPGYFVMGDISQPMAQTVRSSLRISKQNGLVAVVYLTGGNTDSTDSACAFVVTQRGLYSRDSIDKDTIFIPWETLQHRAVVAEAVAGLHCTVELDDGMILAVSNRNAVVKPFGKALISELIALAVTIISVQENSGLSETEKLSGTIQKFAQSLIGENSAWIISLIKEKTGQVSTFALQSDDLVVIIATTLYVLIPGPARLFIKEQTFVDFILKYRNQLLDWILVGESSTHTELVEKEKSSQSITNGSTIASPGALPSNSERMTYMFSGAPDNFALQIQSESQKSIRALSTNSVVIPSSQANTEIGEKIESISTIEKVTLFLIGENRAWIISLIKEKTGQASVFALQNDDLVITIATKLYVLVPGPVRLFLKEQTFVDFILKYRDQLLDWILLDESPAPTGLPGKKQPAQLITSDSTIALPNKFSSGLEEITCNAPPLDTDRFVSACFPALKIEMLNKVREFGKIIEKATPYARRSQEFQEAAMQGQAFALIAGIAELSLEFPLQLASYDSRLGDLNQKIMLSDRSIAMVMIYCFASITYLFHEKAELDEEEIEQIMTMLFSITFCNYITQEMNSQEGNTSRGLASDRRKFEQFKQSSVGSSFEHYMRVFNLNKRNNDIENLLSNFTTSLSFGLRNFFSSGKDYATYAQLLEDLKPQTQEILEDMDVEIERLLANFLE
jgi:hypothetical protein